MRDPVHDSNSPQEEQPLDPAVLRVQQKMRGLLMGSSLIMVIGLVAVFAAIFYKLSANSSNISADNIAATVAIGENARVLSVSMHEGQIVALINENDAQALVYIDPVTGKILGRTNFMAR
ncbi:hypothetical protein E1162_05120 [Rhodobacteraceae bacterium RKSG542]|uniref:hypothetical protein n=1 Tax=Pseudovibrio flavus TaxID=2529854 RepID=UPI0012BD7BFB|nr:hypothetical protein [Pseudovibrio flavus]MTI16619.1 hypothetical protein [Pseudovibrio flavus]